MIENLEIPKNWTFKTEEVASGFDCHVRQQLPWYDVATSMAAHYIRNFTPDNGTVVDIGCSTGNIGVALAQDIKERGFRYIGVDNSAAMKGQFRAGGEFIIADAVDYQPPAFDCCVFFLCLMFIPVSERGQVISRACESMKKGGYILIFDKTEHGGGYEATVRARLTLSMKRESGASAEDIIRKELSLAGYQRPLHQDEIKVKGCHVNQIFQFGDFSGWVITK